MGKMGDKQIIENSKEGAEVAKAGTADTIYITIFILPTKAGYELFWNRVTLS